MYLFAKLTFFVYLCRAKQNLVMTKLKSKDSLGDRMKSNYESRSETRLVRRMPVILRLDGKSFHTFTRKFKKPFDPIMTECMNETMLYLCSKIQGTVLGYTQSDEITLVLVDYKSIDSDAFFDYRVQKMCSIAASMATMQFNRSFNEKVYVYEQNQHFANEPGDPFDDRYETALNLGAIFDCRAFNVPIEEVTNMILWRQQDAIRNSIQGLGQAYFSHNELDHKSTVDIKSMLVERKGISWDLMPISDQRGRCAVKRNEGWVIDNEIPIFVGEGREYIEKRIAFPEDKKEPAPTSVEVKDSDHVEVVPQGDEYKRDENGNLITCGIIIMDKMGVVLGCHPTGQPRFEPHTLDIPKGCAEKGETDLQAAIREVCEETGIDFSKGDRKFVDMGIRPHVKGKNIHVFLTMVDSVEDLVKTCKCTSYFTDKDGNRLPEVDGFYDITPLTFDAFFKKIEAHVREAFGKYGPEVELSL